MAYQTGKCPSCRKMVTPRGVHEANDIRRDVFLCPECGAKILKCMGPGCQDYALGGEYYDDNLCPNCFGNIPKTVATLGGLVLMFKKLWK